jgi:phospholipid transport system substrate-binding protein
MDYPRETDAEIRGETAASVERRVSAIRRGTRVVVLLCAAALAFAAPFAAQAKGKKAAGDPQVVVAGALDDVMAVLNDVGASEASRRDRIADIAFAHFDFSVMSKLVVARPWKKFSDAQKTEFVEEFKTHLARSYGRRLARYEGTQVDVVGKQEEQRGDVTVLSKVVGGQFDGATMDYRMRGKTGEWLVIDVVIEGVSLVSNFRSQFKPILAQGGAAELLGRLKDKNSELHAEILAEEQASSATTSTVSNEAP